MRTSPKIVPSATTLARSDTTFAAVFFFICNIAASPVCPALADRCMIGQRAKVQLRAS